MKVNGRLIINAAEESMLAKKLSGDQEQSNDYRTN